MNARAKLSALLVASALAMAPAGHAMPAIAATPLARAIAVAQGGKSSIEIPSNDGWVTDLGGFLSDAEERELEASMEAYKRSTGHDIALLTVPDLQGRTVEEFALAVGREWKLGAPGQEDGALLLASKAERKLRIEVGRGFEGELTDARCAQIIRNEVTPAFKAGRFDEGIRRGITAMQSATGGAPPPAQRSIPAPVSRVRPQIELGGLVCMVLFAIFVIFLLRRLVRWGGMGRGGFGRRPSPFVWGTLGGLGGFSGGRRGGGFGGGGGGGFSGFGGGGGFSGGGASGGW